MTDKLLEKRALIDSYLGRGGYYLSPFSFINIFAWQDFFDFNLCVIDGSLCVFASDGLGSFLYLPPLGREGRPSGNSISRCFGLMDKINSGSGIGRIENVPAWQLDLFCGSRFSVYMKGYEYCYYKKDIIALKGRRYKSKRSDYNRFVVNNRYSYLSFGPEMIDECIGLYQRWMADRKKACSDDIYQHMLDENLKVHQRLLAYYDELNLIGSVVIVDGKIRAYTFGYELREDVFCVLLEVADLSYRGLPVFIFRQFCADDRLGKYKFINAMDDSGIEGLKRAKMSFAPSVIFPLYTVRMKDQ